MATRPAGSPVAAPGAFRADIEGLRAVAVGLVVLDHLLGWPRGGFVGVDVFFVISGFLITGLLLQETARRGRLSFRGFYARRARRILPAAITVLAVVLVAARLDFRGARVGQTVSDVGWAAAFGANIHFASIGVDYFQADRPPSPVQHFWSLAVEEQFYLLWPLVMVIVLTVIGRRWATGRGRVLLMAVVSVGCLASFGYSLVQTRDATAAAYFSSPGRAWELGVGAAIAIAADGGRRLAQRLGPARGAVWLLGLAGVLVSAIVVPPGRGFPAPWAVLPVVSVALIILTGLAGPPRVWSAPLTNPASRYVGRISYSLYLWHWPVIVLAASLIPESSLRYPISALAMLGLSIAGYHLIEAPFRRLGQRPERTRPERTRPERTRPERTRPHRRARERPGYQLALAAACLAAAAGLVAVVPPRTGPDFTGARPAGMLPLPADEPAPTPTDLRQSIDDALVATRFPADLDPSLDLQGTARAHWTGCTEASPSEVSSCVRGDLSATRTAVVIGDSVAMSWLPAIESALGDRWRVVGLTLEACPAADVSVLDANDNADPACDTHHSWATSAAVALHPQLVVLSSSPDSIGRLADGSTGAVASAHYKSAQRATIDQLAPSGARVVTLAPPPAAGALSACDTAASRPADCVRAVSDDWVRQAELESAVSRESGTRYVDTRNWFCNDSGYCPAVVGNIAVRWDTQHVTDVYARTLAGPLRAALGEGPVSR